MSEKLNELSLDTFCASVAQTMGVKAPECSRPFMAFRRMRSLL